SVYFSVYYTNIVVSFFMYVVLYATAPLISEFYDQPQLTTLTRVLALVFVINAFSYVQEARLTKALKFKKLMVIHLPSTIISGIVAVFMAMNGYGVWSIVAQRLVMRFAFSIQLWIYARWKPLWQFDFKRARALFSFGGNLMASGVINTIYNHLYLIIIGKFFPINQLG